jgi:hypothetical protein
MNIMPHFLKEEAQIPFVAKILPVLESSKHRCAEDDENFKYLRAIVSFHTLRSDNRMHDALIDLTGFILSGDKDKNERLSMECYIALNLPLVRPSIKIMMNEYPECFKLNKAFYIDVLNEKKTDFLTDKYFGIYRKLKPAAKIEPGYAFDDDFYETDDSTPFVREAPKIGRNDPCPCGSGKKYKKCCYSL